jgi:hypothetical protein
VGDFEVAIGVKTAHIEIGIPVIVFEPPESTPSADHPDVNFDIFRELLNRT